MSHVPKVALMVMLTAGTGCALFDSQALIFPIWERNDFEESPAELGPFSVAERRVEEIAGADGEPFGITVFEPPDVEGARPTFFWILGSNVQSYYQQSLHETLASWGYVVIVPDTRLLTLTDFQYHKRNVDLARQAFTLALDGELGVNVDRSRIGMGGYSIGGTLAAMTAALEPEVDTLVFWAPTGSPFWLGLDPNDIVADATQPAYYILAELDQIAPPDGWPAELQELMVQSEAESVVIPLGVHVYFQQPTGGDLREVSTSLTRLEQQSTAIELTRERLDQQLDVMVDEGSGRSVSDN